LGGKKTDEKKLFHQEKKGEGGAQDKKGRGSIPFLLPQKKRKHFRAKKKEKSIGKGLPFPSRKKGESLFEKGRGKD